MLINQDKLLEQSNKLIKGCLKADRHSQSQLYELFAPKMFIVCLRYSRNREEAEETLQEGFSKVFKCIHQYSFAGSFEGWVRKIMVNCALQKYRSKPHLHIIGNIEYGNIEYWENEDASSRLGTKELIKMIQQLPPAYRIVFNLFVFEGMKHREIAELLDISEGTSKSNLSDARAILQRTINKSLQITNKQTISR
jgi:RNA polymerase sigma-70 factor (ECF subfamily)